MPIFEYQCDKCGHQFETIVLGREEDAPECPECGEREVRRKLSAVSIGGLRSDSSCAPSGSGFT